METVLAPRYGRTFLLLLLSWLLITGAEGQQIQNVRFTPSGKQIIINYDITGARAGQIFDVQIFVSTDGGRIFGQALSRVSGDAGSGITGGPGKKVVWDVLSERENLVGNIIFEVQAKAGGTASTFASNNMINQPSSADPYWVLVPGGTFMMGSPDGEAGRVAANETQHQVTVGSFRMGKYEVTFDEYDAFCTATRRKKPDDDGWGRGNRPVMNVTWEDAKAFADWKGCRLPTEAEWEYACRAGSAGPFNTGDKLSSDQANFNSAKDPYNGASPGKFGGKTEPVGAYAPNAFGLYDMHGNVSEWVNDWYTDKYQEGGQNNPKGPEKGSEKIRRGGSWYDPGVRCRSSHRIRVAPDRVDRIIGIRLVAIN